MTVYLIILEQDPYYKSVTYLITWVMDLMCLPVFLYNCFYVSNYWNFTLVAQNKLYRGLGRPSEPIRKTYNFHCA